MATLVLQNINNNNNNDNDNNNNNVNKNTNENKRKKRSEDKRNSLPLSHGMKEDLAIVHRLIKGSSYHSGKNDYENVS